MLVTALSKNDNPADDATHFFRVVLPEGVTLDDALDLSDRDMRASGNYGEFGARELWLKAFRWAMNVVIYATWPDADREDVMMNAEARRLWERIKKLPSNSKKRDRIKDELRALDPRKRIYLGRGVIPDPKPAAGTGKDLEVRVRVQGHWRRQVHGEGRSLRKTIWIQPFWRGPEDGAMGSAVHRLV